MQQVAEQGAAPVAVQPPQPWRAVAWAVAAGGLWRFGYVLLVKRNAPLRLNDSLYYSAQAYQLARGIWFKDVLGQVPAAEHGPLAAIALAPLSRFDDPVVWQRLGNAAYGTVTVALIAVLAHRVAGPRTAVVAAVFAAAYPNLWLNDFVVMSEAVALLCVTAGLLAVIAAIRRPSWPRQVGAGVALGLAALARSELVLLAVLLAAVVAWASTSAGWRRVLPGALVLAGTAAALLPWAAFNLTRFDRPVVLTTNDGTTLVGANCPEVYSGRYIGGWSLFCVLDSLATPVDGDDSVRAGEQRREALRYARDHANRVPLVVAARIARSFDLWGHDNLVHQDVGEERPAWAAWAGVVMWLLMMPLAAVGLRLVGDQERLVLAAPLVSVIVVSALYYGAHRIRSPLEPAAVVLTATALVKVPWRQLGGRLSPALAPSRRSTSEPAT